MRTREQEVEPLVNPSEITEVEFVISKRMRELTIGEHRSRFHGSGFDLVGLRQWEPGDRLSSIDWPQSTITNFDPLLVREFEQRSTAGILAVADRSLSTRCGVDGVPIAAAIARSIATVGMSAVCFQDMFGLVTFDRGFNRLGVVRPRVGKRQVIHCLDAYQHGRGDEGLERRHQLSITVASMLRRTSLVPVMSDFLFDDVHEVLRELSLLNSTHDVFVVLVDAAFAFELPDVSCGWIEALDLETGRSHMMSRGALRRMSGRVREWQDEVERTAKDFDLDVLRQGVNPTADQIALMEFVLERRLKKTS
jgi:uncharacterized protein (DUF58 family)